MKVLIFAVLCYFGLSEAINRKAYCPCATLEQHEITCDGYIKTIFRLAVANDKEQRIQKVLMVPGFTGNSNTFTVLGNQSLACVLFAGGIDVWLENPRGNDFSDRHETLSVDSEEFWEIDFSSLANDVTCTINKVIEKTNATKVHLIGHSLGGAMPFLILSEHPEFAAKLGTIQLLVPAIFSDGKLSLGILGAAAVNRMHKFLKAQKIYSMSWTSPQNTKVVFKTIYRDHEHMRPMNEYLGSGSAMKLAIHMAQHIAYSTPKVCHFDYGLENYSRYGQFSAPEFDLSKVTIPIDVWHGGKDEEAPPICFTTLKSKVPSVNLHLIDEFNHYDYIYEKKAEKLIYEPMRNNILGRQN